jgi:hypothetical protein
MEVIMTQIKVFYWNMEVLRKTIKTAVRMSSLWGHPKYKAGSLVYIGKDVGG